MDATQILSDLKRVSCNSSFLNDLVEKFPYECHVRDVQTKKYLLTNYHHVSSCGLKAIGDIVGLTRKDILEEIQKKANLNSITISNHIENINLAEKIEDQIYIQKSPISSKHLTIRKNGAVKLEHSFKCGVMNHDQKVIAILAIYFDLTDQVPLLKLFRLYQEFYSRKEAAQKFLNHFNLEGCFDPYAPLTHREIEILISMHEDSRCKVIANKFGCSVPTASNHIHNINGKLRSGTIHDVLTKLRAIPENEQSAYLYI